jgi:hypothetical protein
MREDRVGKLFVMMFTNGDLPTNPMCLRECLVCGEVFNRIDSLAHTKNGVPAVFRTALGECRSV